MATPVSVTVPASITQSRSGNHDDCHGSASDGKARGRLRAAKSDAAAKA